MLFWHTCTLWNKIISTPITLHIATFVCLHVYREKTWNLLFYQISNIQYIIINYSHHIVHWSLELIHLITESLYPLTSSITHTFSTEQVPIYSLLVWVWLLKSPHTSDIMQYLSISVWLILFSIVSPRLTHVVTNNNISFSFKAK